MKRLLLRVLSITIVAAFQVPLRAAAEISENVPVIGGTAAFARALGVASPPDRARFVAELARIAYSVPGVKSVPVAALLQRAAEDVAANAGAAANAGNAASPLTAASASPPDVVPVPLTAEIWSAAVFRRRITPSELVAAILTDREAALVCHGLAALDDPTLQFLAAHTDLITLLYERAAPAFAAFASSLHIHDGRVVPPGGDAASAMWESAVGAPLTRPDRFVRALFTTHDGRLAYLYDGIGHLDPARAAFALGLWMRNASTRAARFKALVEASRSGYREWHIDAAPFARPIFDVITLLVRVRVEADGGPAPPASRAFWTAVFDAAGRLDLPAGAVDRSDEVVDAAWLAATIASGEVRLRGERLEQLSFAQRAFAGAAAADRTDAAGAVSAFPRLRMLMLTLDRMSLSTPALYVAAARHADRLAGLDGRRGFTALAQFQSALALIARMRTVRTIDAARAEALVGSLAAVPVSHDGYRGELLEWLRKELRPTPASASDWESGIMTLAAGQPAHRTAAVHVTWEGERYQLDLASAEALRLRRVRERQGGVPVDTALEIEGVARTLGDKGATAADVAAGVAVLKQAAAGFAAAPAGSSASPSGVEEGRDPQQAIAKAIEDLTAPKTSRDPKRAARVVEPLTPVAEALAANALLSLTYAMDLGDPDGTVLLAGNVAGRHDFGFAARDAAARARVAWDIPKEEVGPNIPWHVSGSALGLDVALASLALRRVDSGRVTGAPKLSSNDRQTFAVSVALMNPFALTDADRDAIAEAVARGRARVTSVTPSSLDALADEIALDGWRRRAAAWSLANDAGSVDSLFSLTELLRLGGGPPPAALDAWGMAALVSEGCLCTRLAPPGTWSNLTGRPQLGLLGTSVADLTLHVAVALHDLGLPAAIARHVLSAAVQDYIDEVQPNDNADWLTMVRRARAVSRERIEDYVAGVTADGPLVPDPPARDARP